MHGPARCFWRRTVHSTPGQRRPYEPGPLRGFDTKHFTGLEWSNYPEPLGFGGSEREGGRERKRESAQKAACLPLQTLIQPLMGPSLNSFISLLPPHSTPKTTAPRFKIRSITDLQLAILLCYQTRLFCREMLELQKHAIPWSPFNSCSPTAGSD